MSVPKASGRQRRSVRFSQARRRQPTARCCRNSCHSHQDDQPMGGVRARPSCRPRPLPSCVAQTVSSSSGAEDERRNHISVQPVRDSGTLSQVHALQPTTAALTVQAPRYGALTRAQPLDPPRIPTPRPLLAVALALLGGGRARGRGGVGSTPCVACPRFFWGCTARHNRRRAGCGPPGQVEGPRG